MSDSSPEPARRGSPKRKRSDSVDLPVRQYDGATDAKLRYAHEEDPPSDAEQAFHTPEEGDEEVNTKRRKVERPRRLNYIPYMTLTGHKRGVSSVKFSPDGKWIASCCRFYQREESIRY